MFHNFGFKLKITMILCLIILLQSSDFISSPIQVSSPPDSQLDGLKSIKNIHMNKRVAGTSTIVTAKDDIPVSLGLNGKNSSATAVDTDGNLFTVYTYTNSTHYFLELMQSNDSENWSRIMHIYSPNLLENPDIAIDLFNNNIYVVYEEAEVGNSSSHDIYIFRYNQWDIVGVDTDAHDQRNPAIAIEATYGSDNHIYVAYEQVISHNESKMIVQKSTTHGDSWTSWHTRGFLDQKVHTQMDIAVDFSGQVYLTYAWGENYSAPVYIIVEFGPRDSTNPYFEVAGWVFSETLPVTLNFPVIAVSRSTAITTRIAIAFEYIWGPLQGGDADIIVSSSSDGGATWSDSYIASSVNPEQKPNIVSDGMDLDSSTEGRGYFYLVYSILDVNNSFVILNASYSSLTNWKEMYTYRGTHNIANTKRTFGMTTYSNESSKHLVVTYAATSCYGCPDAQVYSTVISSKISEIGSFTFTSPNSVTRWTVGTIELIRWNYTGTINFVNIFLYKGDTTLGWIAQGAPNLGYYDWGIPDFLVAGTDYWVDIEDANDTSVYAFSSQFEIIVENPRIYFTNPTPVSAWRVGATYVITWNCKILLGEVTLELLKSGDLEDELSDDIDGEGHYKWEIPDDLSEDDDYQLRIFLNSNSNTYGISEEFKIISSFIEKEESTQKEPPQFLPTPGFNLMVMLFGLTIIILLGRKRG